MSPTTTTYYENQRGPRLWSGIFAGFFIALLGFWELKITKGVSMSPTTTTYYENQRGPRLWSGIFAGFFIALLGFWVLFCLGIAIGGHSLSAIARDDIAGLGVGAAVWTFICAAFGCLLGGYYCSRFVSYASWKAGIAEGLVVSSLFFLALTIQSSIGIGFAGAGAAKTASLATGAASALVDRPEVQNIIGNSLNGLNLRSDPTTVASTLIVRLARGDQIGATNYLAYQTGQSPAAINSRITQMSVTLDQAVTEIKTKAGNALASIGWFTFVTVIVGSFLCCIGAGMGAKQNATAPLGVNISRPLSV